MNILEINSLSISVAGTEIIKDMDLNVVKDERWGILGANGAGKTSLLHSIIGLRKRDKGRILVKGKDINEFTPKRLAAVMGILFQDNHDTFPMTVFDAVLAGRYPHSPFWSFHSDIDMQKVTEALISVDMSEMGNRYVNTLSGGERRRVALATLLAQSPQVWLMDEPTNHLDMHYQIALLDLVDESVRKTQGALIMVLHDVNLLLRYCSHAILMIGGNKLLSGKVEDIVTKDNLESLYGHPIHTIKNENQQFFLPG